MVLLSQVHFFEHWSMDVCQSNAKGSGRNAGKRVAWKVQMLHVALGCYVCNA